MKVLLAGALVIVAGAVALLFGLAVWPTMYESATLRLGQSEYPVRIHRLTGETQVLTRSGWVRQGAMAPEPTPRPVVAQPAQVQPSGPPPDCKGPFDDIVHDECKQGRAAQAANPAPR
jgi:hypothetical protein